MTLFPFFEDIEGKTFLIVGGGRVASGKAARLRQFTDRILVIAPKTDITGITCIRRAFQIRDLEMGDYVIAATDDPQLNRDIAKACRDRGKPVDVADNPSLCSWYFPAVVKRGPLVAAVSTSGTSPAYARRLKEEIEDLLPEHTESMLESMGALRSYLSDKVPVQKRRRALLQKALARMLENPQLCGLPPEQILEIVSETGEET